MSEEAKRAERARELEEKKARLEAYRVKRRVEKTLPESSAGGGGAGGTTAAVSSGGQPSSAAAEALLASVLRGAADTPTAAVAETPVVAPAVVTPASVTPAAVTPASVTPAVTPAVTVTLVSRRQAAVQEAPPRVVETYARSVQTEETRLTADAQQLTDEQSQKTDEPKQEQQQQQQQPVEPLPVKKEDEPRIISPAERARLVKDAALLQWAERAGELAERALRAEELAGIDILRDLRRAPEKSAASAAAGSAGEAEGQMWDSGTRLTDRTLKDRPVIALQQSPHAVELCLAAYEGADGLACLWALDGSLDRPVVRLSCDQRLTRAVFSPTQPTLVAAGCYGGQLVLWDTRAGNSPVLEAAGSGHPVTGLSAVGSSHAPLLHAVSSDGRQASWSLLNMSHALSSQELRLQGGQAVSPTCTSFAMHETDAFFFGSEQGRVHSATRTRDEELGAGVQLHSNGPVRGISHHPPNNSGGANVLASCGSDWRVRIWNSANSAGGNTLSLDIPTRCPASAVQWSPTHPSVLYFSDLSGSLYAWDVARDVKNTACSVSLASTAGAGITSFYVHSQGCVVGDTAGNVALVKLSQGLLQAQAPDVAWSTLSRFLQ